MTPITAILAFPAGPPNTNNSLICDVVEQLDQCSCAVVKLKLCAHRFNLATPAIMAMLVYVRTDHELLDDATEDEKEGWLIAQFDLNTKLPDCAITEIK